MPITLNGSGGVTTNSGAIYDGLQRGTAVNSTSGTAILFTGIPSWAKRISVIFNVVAKSSTTITLIQVGTSGGLVTTGYTGVTSQVYNTGAGTTTSTSGFPLFTNNGNAISGTIFIYNVSGNIWVANGNVGSSPGIYNILTGGAISLSGVLDRVNITAGPDTYSAGSINIMWE